MKTFDAFPNLYLVDHPLVQHKLTEMRQTNCQMFGFRSLLREISLLMGYEVTRNLPLGTKPIETPVAPMNAPTLSGAAPAIVPILRAGMVMADGLHELLPMSPVGHIGLYRDHDTHLPVEYMVKLPPDAPDRFFILVDPMLATGHSASYALDVLLKHGVAPERILFLALVGAPEGVRYLLEHHPKVKIFIAGLDEQLNEKAYIVPGLGDAGDRLFGTV